MDIDTYQDKARSTAIYPDINNNFTYPALGLCGEAGEVAEKCKKIIRDQGGVKNSGNVDAIKKELGDCLWYIANLASEFELNLSEVALCNIDKLFSRKERGVLGGSGDNR